jgi:hypothetical protein
MNIPNREHAVVEHEKVRDYLLNPAHPDGFGKAEFYTAMGFRRETWQVLAGALRQVAVNSPVTKSMTSIHGHKYIVDGLLQAPSGRTAMVRTVWIVDTGKDTPRLITAYPREQEP